MKNKPSNMKQNQLNDQLNDDQLNELENDAVWSLLEQANKESTTKASPLFARNIMREIRLNQPEPANSLWHKLTSSTFNKIGLSLAATAACAAIIITISPNQHADPITTTAQTESHSDLESITFDEIIAFPDSDTEQIALEMLELASQDPLYLSEEEIETAMQM